MTSTADIKLIVGLGNPGSKYVGTPHNAGFQVIDSYLSRQKRGITTEKRFHGEHATLTACGRKVHLLKPMTYMNLSGNAVKAAQKSLKLLPQEILVIYDCLDLPVGRMRIRPNGSSGGQKGMQSIIDEIGSNQIPRCRIGIRDNLINNVVDYVLTPLPQDLQSALDQTVEKAAEAIDVGLRQGITKCMNMYNRLDLSPESHDEQLQERED